MRASRRSTLAAREARLAFWMLAPTFLIVFAIVLFPVVANFWISFKAVKLADLETPQPLVQVRVLGTPCRPGRHAHAALPDAQQLANRHRDRRDAVRSPSRPGLVAVDLDPRCAYQAAATCSAALGSLGGGPAHQPRSRLPGRRRLLRCRRARARRRRPAIRGRAPNVLTNLRFTLANFRRILSGAEFWPALWVTPGLHRLRHPRFDPARPLRRPAPQRLVRGQGCAARACSSSPTSPR